MFFLINGVVSFIFAFILLVYVVIKNTSELKKLKERVNELEEKL